MTYVVMKDRHGYGWYQVLDAGLMVFPGAGVQTLYSGADAKECLRVCLANQIQVMMEDFPGWSRTDA
jgi:hypothetical protein